MDGKISEYKTTDTLGKSQLDLIIKVYDGAIASYKETAEHIRAENTAGVHESLEKARRFVTHLYATLDPEKGGEVAENLGKLYAYVINLTNIVDATKDLSQIDDIITVLNNVRLGWVGLKEDQAVAQTLPKGDKENSQAFTTSA
jgi:flagellar protein FliS